MSTVSSFQQAYEEYSKQNFQKSYSLFDKSIETLRQDSVMLQERNMIFINLEKYEEALIYLDKILIINPNDVEILIRKGKSCEILGKTEQAIECFNHILSIQYLKSLKITSNDTDVLQNVSLHMVHLLGKEHAVPIFKSLIENDPNDILAQNGLKIFSTNPIYDY